MSLQLTAGDWRAIFPRAPQDVINAFASPKGMEALRKAGILETKTRLAYACANVEHECGGFTIPRLTENINYTAERMHAVWPNRFSSADAVRAKYGTAPGWQKRAFDDIYGGRMGNHPGTADGSTYIGRAGPQVTGRDGYRSVGRLAGLDLENFPDMATMALHQPAILAAFWSWKNMNQFADTGNFKGAVKSWNGGTNGMADREAQLRGNDSIIERLAAGEHAATTINKAPGAPPRNPSGKAVKDATKHEQVVVGGGGAVAGGAAAAPGHTAKILIVMGAAAVVVVLFFVVRKFLKMRKVWRSPTAVLPTPAELRG